MNRPVIAIRNFEDQAECLKKTDAIQRIMESKSWHKRLKQIVQSKWSIERKFDGLYELADELCVVTRPFSACDSLGCSHCCNIACAISDVEAERIGKAIKRKPVPQAPMSPLVLEAQRERRETLRAPCTFLKNGRCSIYRHRPLACRIMHNVGTGIGCDLSIPSKESNVPSYDFRPLTTAAALICVRAGLTHADIRDYFPDQ